MKRTKVLCLESNDVRARQALEALESLDCEVRVVDNVLEGTSLVGLEHFDFVVIGSSDTQFEAVDIIPLLEKLGIPFARSTDRAAYGPIVNQISKYCNVLGKTASAENNDNYWSSTCK
jgi:hypothetical protein